MTSHPKHSSVRPGWTVTRVKANWWTGVYRSAGRTYRFFSYSLDGLVEKIMAHQDRELRDQWLEDRRAAQRQQILSNSAARLTRAAV